MQPTYPIRQDWTQEEVAEIFHTPLMELIYKAATVHRAHHDPSEMQMCKLLSIKTGGCPEDCKYCCQSAHNPSGIKAEPLMEVEEVLADAKAAKQRGCTRFCMGAAWRGVRNSRDFERVLTMVKEINAMDMEVCVTLGLLTEEQAERLKEAGLYAYNHNLDTGREYYKQIITTRSYEDRLDTLDAVRSADISICCGGIIGMGERDQDRIDLLHTLATLPQHPESVPINALVPMPGTPMKDAQPASVWDMVRMIATARILMPRAMVRLTAGREKYSPAEQALCFLAGANSIFVGEKLLTKLAPLPSFDQDEMLMGALGMKSRVPFKEREETETRELLCCAD